MHKNILTRNNARDHLLYRRTDLQLSHHFPSCRIAEVKDRVEYLQLTHDYKHLFEPNLTMYRTLGGVIHPLITDSFAKPLKLFTLPLPFRFHAEGLGHLSSGHLTYERNTWQRIWTTRGGEKSPLLSSTSQLYIPRRQSFEDFIYSLQFWEIPLQVALKWLSIELDRTEGLSPVHLDRQFLLSVNQPYITEFLDHLNSFTRLTDWQLDRGIRRSLHVSNDD